VAVTLNSNINAGLTWTHKSITDISTLTDAGELALDGDMQHGTGYNQSNILWHYSSTLESGGNETIDTFSLTKTLFYDSFTISLSGAIIKCLTINNISSGDMELIFDPGIIANPFNGPVRGGTGTIDIPAKSAIVLSNTRQGWPVNASQRYLYVNDTDGSGCTYEIAILGVTGA